ncbi:MAG: hypothetical protein R3C45_06475 [Phycisphaerales bacterium]
MSKCKKPSRVIGPEDVRVGDYVTVTHTTYEFLMDRCADFSQDEVKPRRVTLIPWNAGRPLQVLSVCLPFVLVRDISKATDTLDLRQHRIARLRKAYGRKAFEADNCRENG